MTDARALAGHLRLHPGRRDGPAISGGRPDCTKYDSFRKICHQLLT